MRGWLIVGLIGTVMLVGAADVSAASNIPSCGTLRASVPYSHHGNHDRWRVYVLGRASCSDAIGVLKVVMHLGGAIHNGSSSANSYTDYQGWRCPFGQMGEQTCIQPKRRPYKTQAIALDCVVSCPATLPRSFFVT